MVGVKIGMIISFSPNLLLQSTAPISHSQLPVGGEAGR